MSTSPARPNPLVKARQWLEERFPLQAFLAWGSHKTVPVSENSIWYYFGGATLFLFFVQIATGILLMFYYKPSAEIAFESVRFISATAPFGWLIRSIHAWSANLMILCAFVHMFSVFFMRAYQKPRELTWLTGMMLLAILMGFGFSGYLLPWNELAFFATKVGTDMIGVIPVIGHPIMTVLRGGEEVGDATLPRFFALHVALLPALLTSLIAVHLFFIQVQGMHEPEAWAHRPEKRKTMRFFPHFLLREVLIWLVLIDILAILAVFFPAELGNKADPFAPAPAGIKPEWYFLFMYQALKFFPAKIGPIDGELVGLGGFALAGMAWVFLPWIDRSTKMGAIKIVRAVGIFVVLFMVTMTALGYVMK